MSDSGLSSRLRQQSRRAGLMVGITMVLAMAILIFGAAGAFAWLSRPFSDLIPMAAPAGNAPVVEAPAETATEPTPAADEAQVAIQVEPTEAPATEPTAAPTDEEFVPTHQIAGETVNFRSGPSRNDAIIEALPPATPLLYLDEEAPTDNPTDGDRWMMFRDEEGEEGWVREIDTEPYQP